MGDSKRRRHELTQFLATLSVEERTIFDLSERISARIVRGLNMTGGCYRITFLLKAILEKEHQIQSDAIVGFVNDGTDDTMISHAWLEYRGRKIDLTLANVEQGQNRGPLLILDYEFKSSGAHKYSYHQQRGERGDQVIKRLLEADSHYRNLIAQKEQEHLAMSDRAKSLDSIINYLDSAPDGYTYEKFLQALR